MSTPMNYLCFVDGLLEFASSDPSSFAHYQLVYAEEHKNANVQYLTLTDEEYDEMFPYEEDEQPDLDGWEDSIFDVEE